MKMSTLAWAGVLSCTLFACAVSGQQLKQPLSVQPIGFNYNNVEQTAVVGEAANSVADPVGSSVAATPAPVVATVAPPVASSCGAGCAPLTPAPSCGAPACGPLVPACGCDVSAPVCGPSCGSCSSGCDGGCALGLCDCNLGDAWTLSGAIHGDCEPTVNIGGWFQAGYHSESTGLFNSRPDELSLHQAWLYAEKAATCDSPFGFRADLMYGIDANDTQAFGNNPGEWDYQNGFDHGAYGWAIPQLYGEVALNENWSVKAGHFYTLVGYEVVTAPDNFFYSHAITMYNSEPFTHTGFVATGNISDNLTVYAGWTLGWDTGFDQLGDGSSWLGGFSYSLSDNASLTYISTAGDFGWRGDEAYSHSLVLDMTVTDNLNWVVQSDLVDVGSTGEENIGINQYFIYSVTDCLGLGARAEWWKADGTSFYEATFGANIRPHANVVVRPEVRFDWSPAGDFDQSLFGIDAIFTF